MKNFCRTLSVLLFVAWQPSWASQRLEQAVSTANRVHAIGQNGEALVSYHPGRISVLSILRPDSERFAVLTALPRRGEFVAGPWNENTLWVAFLPVDGCEADARLLRVSTTTAERSHRAQFLTSRGHLDGRAIDLSIHENVNAQIGYMANRWGNLDQRDWPGVQTIDLPEGLCPLRWEAERLLLVGDEQAALFDPRRETVSTLSGNDWLFDESGHATHYGDESALSVNNKSIPLPANADWRWIGRDDAQHALLWVQTDVEAALYRVRETALEVLFSQPGYQLAGGHRMATGKAASIELYEAGTSPYDLKRHRQLYLDHSTSARLRSIEKATQREHWLVSATTETAPLLTRTTDHFWAVDTAWSNSPIEGVMPWLDVADVERTATAALWIDGDWRQMESGEARGLEWLGISIKSGANQPFDACTWTRQQRAEGSKTTVACPWGIKFWNDRLALESDTHRLARLQDIASFVFSVPSDDDG